MDTYTSLMKMNSDLINLIDDYIKVTIKGYEKCRNEFIRDIFIDNDYFTYLVFNAFQYLKFSCFKICFYN